MYDPAEVPQALFFHPLSDGSQGVQCSLCGQRCLIPEGQRGQCRVRENRGGVLVPLAYGRLAALRADPIEKKPLFHFYPGSRSFSIAAAGCNLRCPWCQNAELAQGVGRHDDFAGPVVPPEEVVEEALEAACRSISYTYSEPTIHYEYNREVGILARARGLKNVFVTNGMMTEEVVQDAATTFLDAANVDLKAMNPDTYRQQCRGGAQGHATVLAAIEALHRLGVWVEVTTLVIPGLNDGEAELRAAARFLRGISPDLPWHLSRYHPAHRWHQSPPTDAGLLHRAREWAHEEGLHYVYTGNLWDGTGEQTNCPKCGQLVLQRRGYVEPRTVGLAAGGSGTCAACGEHLAGVGWP